MISVTAIESVVSRLKIFIEKITLDLRLVSAGKIYLQKIDSGCLISPLVV